MEGNQSSNTYLNSKCLIVMGEIAPCFLVNILTDDPPTISRTKHPLEKRIAKEPQVFSAQLTETLQKAWIIAKLQIYCPVLVVVVVFGEVPLKSESFRTTNDAVICGNGDFLQTLLAVDDIAMLSNFICHLKKKVFIWRYLCSSAERRCDHVAVGWIWAHTAGTRFRKWLMRSSCRVSWLCLGSHYFWASGGLEIVCIWFDWKDQYKLAGLAMLRAKISLPMQSFFFFYFLSNYLASLISSDLDETLLKYPRYGRLWFFHSSIDHFD